MVESFVVTASRCSLLDPVTAKTSAPEFGATQALAPDKLSSSGSRQCPSSDHLPNQAVASMLASGLLLPIAST